MMSAKIRLLKSNILKNKNTKLFCKTMSSKFFHKAKSPKITTDVTLTKSTTKFSDNNLTKTLQSSKYKDESFFMSLQEFHKNFILNKNNSLKEGYITNYDNKKIKKVMNLKKYSLSPSLIFSSDENKSGIIPNIQKNKINLSKNNNDMSKINEYSFFTFYDKNKENKGRNKTIRNIFNRNKKYYYNKNIKTIKNNQLKSELFDLENNKSNKKIRNTHIFNTKNNINNVEMLNKIFSASKEKLDNKEIHFKNDDKDEKIKIYYGRNIAKLQDKFAYPNYHFLERIEPFKEFFYKTKINIFNNYRKYLNINTYFKHAVKINFDIDREILRERNLKKFEILFKTYKQSLEEYVQFLHKKYREIQDENVLLIKNKFKMEEDNDKLKLEIMRGLTKIREGFTIKYFLTCVKNHTLTPEKFSPEDFKEIEQEKLKLNESYYLSTIRKKRKRNSYKKPSISNIFFNNNQVRKIQEHSLTKKLKDLSSKKVDITTNDEDNIYYYNKVNKRFLKKNTKNINLTIPKSFRVLETMEEFIENIDLISSSVYNLIIDSTNKYYRNVYLKLELESITKRTSNKINQSNYLQEQISLYEKKLHDLKSKNKILISNLNTLKENQFQRDIKLSLVVQNIHEVYYNIKQENNSLIDITKEMVISYGEHFYLKIIEQFFFKMLFKVNDLKKANPINYQILKNKFDKLKKKNAFHKYQKLLMDEIQIKIDKVLEKAKKVIYKRYRKTNDYKKVHKKQKIKKKEIKKTDLEIFEEYLDDDSF